jgi:hypothetical protein
MTLDVVALAVAVIALLLAFHAAVTASRARDDVRALRDRPPPPPPRSLPMSKPAASEDVTKPEPVASLAPEKKKAPPSTSGEGPAVLADDDDGWDGWLAELQACPHGDVVAALGRVHRDSEELSAGLLDPAVRAAFVSEMDGVLRERIVRFTERAGDEPALLFSRWIEPDLLPTLDALARFSSAAAADRTHPAALALQQKLDDVLYLELDAACRKAGWFGLERVTAFVTRFDPAVHRAAGGKDLPAAAGVVVEVTSPGRLAVMSRERLSKAVVVVGR